MVFITIYNNKKIKSNNFNIPQSFEDNQVPSYHSNRDGTRLNADFILSTGEIIKNSGSVEFNNTELLESLGFTRCKECYEYASEEEISNVFCVKMRNKHKK